MKVQSVKRIQLTPIILMEYTPAAYTCGLVLAGGTTITSSGGEEPNRVESSDDDEGSDGDDKPKQ